MKDEPTKFLEEWMTNFLKNKDLISNNILNLTNNNNKITVEFKTKTQIFHIIPFIQKIENIVKNLKKDNSSLVIYNTKENFDAIFSKWKDLSKNPGLSIYFVNPFSKMDKKWVIFPRTHSLISDKASLKQGLLSLFNTVECVTEEEIKKILS